jgi:transposase-like protein
LDNRNPSKTRDAAVAAVDQRRQRNPRDRTIFREVAEKFAVGEQSLRLWVKKNDDQRLSKANTNGTIQNKASKQAASLTQNQLQNEIGRMRKQIERLKAENDVLKRAFVVFSAEWGEES